MLFGPYLALARGEKADRETFLLEICVVFVRRTSHKRSVVIKTTQTRLANAEQPESCFAVDVAVAVFH